MRSNTSNPARVTSGSVTASSRSTITLDGDIQGDKVDTHLAINGTGFFSVSADPLDNTLGTRYTRAGDFEQYYDSRNGQTYLRNGSGYSLIGVNLSPAVGEDPKGPITIDKTSQSAKASTQITYKLNLPTEPATTKSAANPTLTNANIYNPDWLAGAAAPISYKIANTGKVVGNQVADFMDNSISGGTTTIYDAQGTPAVVQLRWAKVDEAPDTIPVTVPATSASMTGNLVLPTDGNIASLNGQTLYLSQNGGPYKMLTMDAAQFDSSSTRADLINVIQSKINGTNRIIGSTDFTFPGAITALNGETFGMFFSDGTVAHASIGPSQFTAATTPADLVNELQSQFDSTAGPGALTVSIGGTNQIIITPNNPSVQLASYSGNGNIFLGYQGVGSDSWNEAGFGPNVLTASVDSGGHLVLTANTPGNLSLSTASFGPNNFFGTPTSVAGEDAYIVSQPNPDAGRSEWGLFYRNAETYDASDSTKPVWTQVSSNTTITNGKLGRTAVADSSGKAPGAVGWTPTYTNADPTGFFFDKNGKQLDATSAIAIDNLTVGGKNFGTMTLDMGATEFADKNGLATANQLTQDGYSTGAFEGLSIDDNSGIVSYNYSNGQTVQKWKIPIIAFNGASYLKAEDGGAYTETIQSGSPIDIDGSLSSSALEASNVDISEEFTKLIVTQQAFSANSKVITTASQLMDDILQIIR